MNPPHIDVSIAEGISDNGLDVSKLSDAAIGAAMNVIDVDIHPEAELSLLVCDDESIQGLNAQWRDKDKPTNVLSFEGERHGQLLGDIVISIDTLKREAALENKSLNDHFTHLVIHGFLHLLGYDHETDDEADEMEGLETDILNELGIADPYTEKHQS